MSLLHEAAVGFAPSLRRILAFLGIAALHLCPPTHSPWHFAVPDICIPCFLLPLVPPQFL